MSNKIEITNSSVTDEDIIASELRYKIMFYIEEQYTTLSNDLVIDRKLIKEMYWVSYEILDELLEEMIKIYLEQEKLRTPAPVPFPLVKIVEDKEHEFCECKLVQNDRDANLKVLQNHFRQILKKNREFTEFCKEYIKNYPKDGEWVDPYTLEKVDLKERGLNE